MKLRILTESDVRSVIDMKAAIEIQKDAFERLASGAAVDGLRSFARSETPAGIAIFNPCFLRGGRGFGVKVVSDYFGNDVRGVTRMSALMALFDGETGHPRTVMEGGYLTDLRTGAGTGLAARYLAREDSRSLALIGSGRVARNQVAGIAGARRVDRILVAERTRTRGLVAALTTRDGWDPERVSVVASADEAVSQADIVVAATTSRAPVFSGTSLRPGAFVAAVGANAPDARELDDDAVRRAALRVIDSRRDCLANAGDYAIPAGRGTIDLGSVADLSEIVTGARPGRRNDDDIVCYKSIGVPVQDLVTAQAIETEAVARNVGTVIDIGGDYG